MELRIDPEFEGLIRVQTDEEFERLEASMLAEGGAHDPIIIWKNVILDGHHRWKVIQKHPELTYGVKEMTHIQNRADAMIWMYENQLARKNLEKFERAEIALKLKPLYAAQAKARSLVNLKQNSDIPETGHRSGGKVDDKLAAIAGVGHTTLHQASKILELGTEEQKQEARQGKRGVERIYEEVKAQHPEAFPQKRKITYDPPMRKTQEQREAERKDKEQLDAIITEMYSPDVKPFTIEMLEGDVELNGMEYIKILKGSLTEHSTLLVGENRPRIAQKIEAIINEIQKLKELVS